MKTAHVNHEIFRNGYSSALEIRIPTTVDDTGKIVGVTSHTTCREIAIGYFSEFLVPKKKWQKHTLENHKKRVAWATSKARAIFASLSKPACDSIDEGNVLNVLHMLEDEIEFPRTEVYQFEKSRKNQRRRYMFVGSNRWFRSSHTMSLWLLLIRLGIRSATFRQTSWEELAKATKKWHKTENNSGSATVDRDKYYVRLSMKNWVSLMKNLDKIFPPNTKWIERYDSKKVHKAAKGSTYVNSVGTEGISILMKRLSHHIRAKEFYKIMEN